MLGIVSGSFVHTCAAALGLSAILATSARAFEIVKWAGAAYLVHLGVRMLIDRSTSDEEPAAFDHESAWTVYRAGFLTNLLNPKVALFFMAFLPQFVATNADSKILAFLFLGALFMTAGTVWCVVLALSASAMSGRLRRNTSAGVILKRAAGAVFVGLGVKLAVSK